MKGLLLTLMPVLLILSFGTCAMGADWEELNAAQLKGMIEQGDVTVVFPLSRIEYNDRHITGSVNIPMQKLRSKLPRDKYRALVFYCLGPK